jgi:hypothetical protein
MLIQAFNKDEKVFHFCFGTHQYRCTGTIFPALKAGVFHRTGTANANRGQAMRDGSGSATSNCVNICLKFTVAMSGSAPYAQQIVNK